MSSDTSAAPPTLRSLTFSVYLPSVLFAVGQGAVLPVIALSALDFGAPVAVATVATAMRGIGTMLFDIPAGSLIERVGERRAMTIATLILLVALFGCVLSPNVFAFLASVFALGCGWSVWLLARLTYVADIMPIQMRGRALSTLGGVNRIGVFVGPFIGAVMITWMGLDGAYLTHVVAALLGLGALAAVTTHTPRRVNARSLRPPSVARIVRDHRRVLATAGVGVSCLGVLRASRHTLIPLWGAQIGLHPASISLVFGISAAMDMALFYPAGAVSDRFGRKMVVVPCLAIMAVGFALLPLTSTFVQLTSVGVLIGLGNGIGSGIVMTLGADFSPVIARASFLGVWRLVSDAGQAGGPLLAAAASAIATLGAASVVVGGVGLAGAGLLWWAMPETLPETPPDTPPDNNYFTK